MSSVCPFSEVKNLSTDFNRVFNKINAADFVTVVIWKSSRHYDEKSFEKIIHNYVLRFCLFDFFFFFLNQLNRASSASTIGGNLKKVLWESLCQDCQIPI